MRTFNVNPKRSSIVQIRFYCLFGTANATNFTFFFLRNTQLRPRLFYKKRRWPKFTSIHSNLRRRGYHISTKNASGSTVYDTICGCVCLWRLFAHPFPNFRLHKFTTQSQTLKIYSNKICIQKTITSTFISVFRLIRLSIIVLRPTSVSIRTNKLPKF